MFCIEYIICLQEMIFSLWYVQHVELFYLNLYPDIYIFASVI